jgi:acyl transferase domain-containing protein
VRTVRCAAVNHGGKVATVTSPNPFAQARCVEMALRDAQLSPAGVQYIEAHGTGTPKGDPIEINALIRAYASQARAHGVTLPAQSCAIGSVKTSIGHLEAAAGIAGIINVDAHGAADGTADGAADSAADGAAGNAGNEGTAGAAATAATAGTAGAAATGAVITGRVVPKGVGIDQAQADDWARSGDLAALARHWVRSGVVDWQLLRPPGAVRRVALPGHPLSPRRYWVAGATGLAPLHGHRKAATSGKRARRSDIAPAG